MNTNYNKLFYEMELTCIKNHLPRELGYIVISYTRETGDLLVLIKQIGQTSIKTIGDALAHPELKDLVEFEIKNISSIEQQTNQLFPEAALYQEKKLKHEDPIGRFTYRIDRMLSHSVSLESLFRTMRELDLELKRSTAYFLSERGYSFEEISRLKMGIEQEQVEISKKLKDSPSKTFQCAQILCEVKTCNSYNAYIDMACQLLSLNREYIKKIKCFLFSEGRITTAAILLSADLGCHDYPWIKRKIYNQTLGYVDKKEKNGHKSLTLRFLWKSIEPLEDAPSYNVFLEKIWLDFPFLELLIKNNIKALLKHIEGSEEDIINNIIDELFYLKKRMDKEAVECFDRIIPMIFFKNVEIMNSFVKIMVNIGYIPPSTQRLWRLLFYQQTQFRNPVILLR